MLCTVSALQPVITGIRCKSGQKNGSFVDCFTGRSHRSFDYAFYLPLTALAWERIGFRSIILIIGERCEWDSNPALSLILERLKHRMATVVFVKTPLEYRTSMSQISRIFVTNLEEFPGTFNLVQKNVIFFYRI